MSVIENITNRVKELTTRKVASSLNNAALDTIPLYDKLKALYDGNGVYDSISRVAYDNGISIEAIKSLRTVVNRSVEFYVSRILPNPKVVADKKAIQDAIEQFHKWSNFKSKKQILCRELALYGDLFLKVNSDEKKVYFNSIEPRYVTEFFTDVRGFVTEIRFDIPITEDGRDMTYTEYWNQSDGYYAIWIHNKSADIPLDQLGTPKEYASLVEMGIDFVPVVYVKFKDAGDARGQGCVTHALDKIDEANRQATTLPQRLYRYGKPIYAIMGQATSDGKPMPAPKLNNGVLNATLTDDPAVIYFQGGTDMKSLVPDIPYDAALNILNAQMEELEQDLPELKFYSLKDNQLSGKAISLLLAGAISRAEEAQANVVEGLERLNQMALTIGIFLGLFPKSLGKYENGDFEHSIVVDSMFADDLSEKATTLKALVESGVPVLVAMKLVGFSEEEIEESKVSLQEQNQLQNQGLVQALQNFNAQ